MCSRSLLFASDERVSQRRQSSRARLRFKRLDNLDDRNGTQARLRSLSPGTSGCSTFVYPVPYSYRRDARISLFRSYQSPYLEVACRSRGARLN